MTPKARGARGDTGFIRSPERRQACAHWRGEISREHVLSLLRSLAAGFRDDSPALEYRAGTVPQGPVWCSECRVFDAWRRLPLIIGRPVERKEHLPGIEVEFALHLGKIAGLFQPLLQRDVDVARHVRRQRGCEVWKRREIGWRLLCMQDRRKRQRDSCSNGRRDVQSGRDQFPGETGHRSILPWQCARRSLTAR